MARRLEMMLLKFSFLLIFALFQLSKASHSKYYNHSFLPVLLTTDHFLYCSLQVGCHSQWFILDSVVSTVDTVWLTLAIHGFSALRNRYHVSLIAHALILVRYHKQARAVFTVVQWLCKIAPNRSSLLIAME